MDYTHLGRTGLRVSRLALGGMNFGWTADEATSGRIMDTALDAGINLFDTADVYGGPQRPDMEKGYGTSEEIIGRWLAQDGRRDRIVLATKLYQPMGTGQNDRHLSAYHIRKACEDSLRRLKTDRIDLYQMHHVDRATPWEEIWQAMEILVQQGKVLYVGSSNFAGWDIATAQGAAAARHFMGLSSEQSLYNLAVRTVELEVLPAARHHGVGILCWSPLMRGMLAGPPTDSASGNELRQFMTAQHQAKLGPYEAFCREIGAQLDAVALAWLLRNPVVTAPILGPRTVEHLTANLKALDLTLSDETLKRLDEIWPGPGGEAPQAYAW